MTPRDSEFRNFGKRYARGLSASASTNASAYGYSVTITGTFGSLAPPRVPCQTS